MILFIDQSRIVIAYLENISKEEFISNNYNDDAYYLDIDTLPNYTLPHMDNYTIKFRLEEDNNTLTEIYINNMEELSHEEITKNIDDTLKTSFEDTIMSMELLLTIDEKLDKIIKHLNI